MGIDGKIGGYFWEADSVFLGSPVGQEDGSSFWFGGGVFAEGPDFGRFNIGALLHWRRILEISGTDVNSYSLGLSVRF